MADVLVGGVCDGVAVYVLERLLINDQEPLLWAGESSTLILCADGPIEDRSRNLDTGLAVPRKALTEAACDLEARCDAILATLRTSTSTSTDAALLLARVEPSEQV